MRAYEIAEQMLHAFDPETGEINRELWDGLACDLATKLEGMHGVLGAIAGDCATIGAEIKRLQDRKRAAENRAERLREYALSVLRMSGVDTLRTATVTASIRTGSPRAEVADVDALPDAFKRVVVEPDKRAILDALKSGATVEGARLVKGDPSIQFR